MLSQAREPYDLMCIMPLTYCSWQTLQNLLNTPPQFILIPLYLDVTIEVMPEMKKMDLNFSIAVSRYKTFISAFIEFVAVNYKHGSI